MHINKAVLIKLHKTRRKIFREVEKELTKSRRKRLEVNVEKIYRLLKDSEKAIVVGKVIGILSKKLVEKEKKKIEVYANGFTKRAYESLINNGLVAKKFDDLTVEELKNLKNMRLIK
ncbi:MAG: hypothetical protein QW783_04170 [Candidatus Micrarchaeia archaeon]